MTVASNIVVRLGRWDEFKDLAGPIRLEVFVHEQKVPLEEELDAADVDCVHAVAFDTAGHAVGTGRLLPDGHIGRMAVRQTHRGQGVGGKILQDLIARARSNGLTDVVLSAQTHAVGFYHRHGFVEEGEEYLDANIPHMTMRRKLVL